MKRGLGMCVLLGMVYVVAGCAAIAPPETSSRPAAMANSPVQPNPAPAPTDEAAMVRIPAGEFLMGHNDSYDTSPARRISLPAFLIDKYEVTNNRYKRFIDATMHKVPWSPDAALAPYAWDWQARMYPDGKGDDPVVLVSWEDARAFCAWAGKALPTEAEWEKAARGSDGKTYPWGNAWLPGRANTMESGLRETAPTGVFEGDVSEYGVYDLAGNVSEWVEDWFAPYPGNSLISYDAGEKYKVLRGGSWDYFHSIATGYHRQYALPQSQMAAIGFRCVKRVDEAADGQPREGRR